MTLLGGSGTATSEEPALTEVRDECVAALGPDLAAAREAAYALVDGVRLDGAQYRTDIGLAAVEGRITV